MAEVYLARAKGEGNFTKLVVVKRMLPQLAVEQHAVEMFLDEALLGSKLHHPHIVSVLDLGKIDGEYFMVLEHVDGVDLGTLDMRARHRNQPLPLQLITWVIARAAEGLQAAHDARDPDSGEPLKVIHRDVSPSNILLSRSGEVKVADFGVARSTAQESHTTSGALKGKIAYMSPEQLLGQEMDARSDIFSLGTVLWQLVTRRRRHESRNELHIMQTTVQEAALAPSMINPDVTPELDAVVLRMMDRERDQRYGSMREVARELDRFAMTHGFVGRLDFETWLTQHGELFDLQAPQGRELASPPHGRSAPTREAVAEPSLNQTLAPTMTLPMSPAPGEEGLPEPSRSPPSMRHTPTATPSAPRVVAAREASASMRAYELGWDAPRVPPAGADIAPAPATFPPAAPEPSAPPASEAPAAPPAGEPAADAPPGPDGLPSVAEWERLADTRILQSPESRSQLVNGQAVILTTVDRTLHTLNSSATFIWNRADGEHSLRDIAEELPRAFAVSPDIARAEVLAFVEEAMRQGLLVFVR